MTKRLERITLETIDSLVDSSRVREEGGGQIWAQSGRNGYMVDFDILNGKTVQVRGEFLDSQQKFLTFVDAKLKKGGYM
jgi:hypothetical protein